MGAGGFENRGGKGHAFDSLDVGERKTLLDVSGSGMITRMWFTLDVKTTETLRGLTLEMYWDGAKTPAVAVPFGDFFGAVLGRNTRFENALFASPEARSYNCYIPMPFWKSARVVVANESTRPIQLLFYDIDYLLGVDHPSDALYFHAYWHRENPTRLQHDFEILPPVTGAGRFLGAHIGVQADPHNIGWWGEGEVKIYIDGDTSLPTLVGTGTEDYIGTGWGQGVFANRFQGSLVSDDDLHLYSFYRYHVPDPIYFDRDIRVTIQQMGGDGKSKIIQMLEEGRSITPVSAAWRDEEGTHHFAGLLEGETPIDIREFSQAPNGAWTNYFREDDVSAVALFYLNSPENGLPPLAPGDQRVEGLE